MFKGDDVVYFVWEKAEASREMAILTAILGALLDILSQGCGDNGHDLM